MEWGFRTKSGTLSQPSPTSPQYGERKSTKTSTKLPIHPLVVIDIHAATLGLLSALKAWYADGWKDSWWRGKPAGLKWRPDRRKQSTAMKARKELADYMGIPEGGEEE